tara:strand:- start:3156 stop:3290 length:135 start_codon:yes stop_codon:yes gene_type:complete
MKAINPTNEKDEDKGEAYTLEDKDYLLIQAIRDLTNEIERARLR